VITHPLQPTFIDRVAGKSLVAAKATVAKKHSNDEKCRRNGLRLITMAWETFDGSAPETRIMIRKIAIRHTEKHNHPREQTIYQINQRLSVTLQRGVGEQLIAYNCAD
jgi:DNA invertase Pin-like site-specific DNA recombinase